MEVASGQVNEKPFARLVYTTAARRFTGDLILKQNNKTYRLSWEDGVMVAADSPEPADQPGRIALQAGLVDSTTLTDAVKRAFAEKRDVLDVIGELGNLSADQLLKVRRQALGMRAIRIFALHNATYVLDNARSMKPDPSISSIDVRWMIYQGLKTHYTLARLEQDLQALGSASIMLDPNAVSALGYFGFGHAEHPLLEEMRKRPMTLTELAGASINLDRQGMLSFVYALVACDCLTLQQHAQPSVPTPAQAPSRPVPVAANATPAPVRTQAAAPPRVTAPPPMGQAQQAQQAQQPQQAAAAGPARADVSARHWRQLQNTDQARAPEGSQPHVAVPVATKSNVSRTAEPRKRDSAAPQPVGDQRTNKIPGRNDHTVRLDKTGKITGDQVRAIILTKRDALNRSCTHFELLDLTDKATPEQVRQAYFRLARNLHPDRLQALNVTDMAEEAQEVFSRINEAFAVVSNTKRLAEYRRELAAGLSGKTQQDAEELAAKLFAAEEHFLKGQMCLRRNAFAEALREFKQAYELNPEEPEHIALLAWTTWCSTTNKNEISAQVEKLFETAFKMSQKCAPAWFYSAKVAAQQGKEGAAVKRLEKVLELDPKHHEAAAELRVMKTRSAGGKPKR